MGERPGWASVAILAGVVSVALGISGLVELGEARQAVDNLLSL